MTDLRELLEGGEFDGGHALIIEDEFWRAKVSEWKRSHDAWSDFPTDKFLEELVDVLYLERKGFCTYDGAQDTQCCTAWSEGRNGRVFEDELREALLTALRKSK